MKTMRAILGKAQLFLFLATSIALGANGQLAGERELQNGARFLESGDFPQAVLAFTSAAKSFELARSSDRQADALLRLMTAYQFLGEFRQAETVGTQAALVVRGTQKRELDHSLATIRIVTEESTDLPEVQSLLEQHLHSARELNDPATVAQFANTLGTLHQKAGRYREALVAYSESAAAARTADHPLQEAQALSNAALVSLRVSDAEQALASCAGAFDRLKRLPSSTDKANLCNSLGRTLLSLSVAEGAFRPKILAQAEEVLSAAISAANGVGNRRASSFAFGYLGNVCELSKRSDDALRLTRKALFYAQQANVPDAAYLWEWQTGRLYRFNGDLDKAITAYGRATDILSTIRSDVIWRQAGDSFRESTGKLFFELADLLFAKADQAHSRSERTERLRQAQETIERLRSSELEDYLKDECVKFVHKSNIGSMSPDTAVLYIIPFEERLELLVGLSGRLEHFPVRVTRQELTRQAHRLREFLEKRTTDEYLEPAAKLYDWLIAPIAGELRSHNVETLVVVPDEPLRAIPLAALHDRTQFLVQQYAVAVSTGLTLLDSGALGTQEGSVLIAGLSKPVEGFAALRFVRTEIQSLQRLYGARADVLSNEEFTQEAFSNELKAGRYSIVHIASHGFFESDSRESYLQTSNGKLTLQDLEQLVRPKRYRGQPVELLTLSACDTAAGDDRAALGLAGVAVKSGARSALATLWAVDDGACAELVARFYARLRYDPHLSKAKALQLAQNDLITDTAFDHPGSWAPFLIVGNWK